jgi:hypothetical protein
MDRSMEGEMARLSGAISWYPNKSWRIEFNCGHGVLLTRGGGKGHVDAFQWRAQFGF